MIAEVNVFGVYISSGLFAAMLAGLIHLGLRRLLQTVGFIVLWRIKICLM